MGFFNKKKVVEERADVTADDVLLSALLGTSTITKQQALNIPSLQSCIKFAADTVSMLPIKLYREFDGKVEEVKNDPRIRLLNDDTGDTLDAVQFWRALITDYYLGSGGYAYIRKQGNTVVGLHYVNEESINTSTNVDPIFKDYDILVNGNQYKPYDFIKLLRNTKDGSKGSSIIEESNLILSVVYESLIYEEALVKKGGNKRGFLKSQGKLDTATMDSVKAAWKNLYSNNTENIMILNSGMEFAEASNTSVESQMNENKKTNSGEICKLFNFPVNMIDGIASEKEYSNGFKMGILPLLKTITCALNKDLLLEVEKGSYYYAFDTKEMLKGNIKERFEAYKLAIDSNFLQIDEVRFMEDLEELGIKWIKLGLDSVLYDIETGQIYTPNTNEVKEMKALKTPKEEKEGEIDEGGDKS